MPTIDDRDTMLGRGDQLWEQLRRALDERVAHDGRDRAAHDVYAHLARWQAHTNGELRHFLADEPPTPVDGTEDEINDRWTAEDRRLATEVVRARCFRTREELRAALTALTPEQWNRFARACSPDVNGEHYQHHLSGLVEDQT